MSLTGRSHIVTLLNELRNAGLITYTLTPAEFEAAENPQVEVHPAYTSCGRKQDKPLSDEASRLYATFWNGTFAGLDTPL